MPNHIGFTGTQRKLPKTRYDALRAKLLPLHGYSIVLHHGDCIGSDRMAHIIAKDLGFKIHIHPPIDRLKRANMKGDIIEKAYPYLQRNKFIVDACGLIIAMPKNPNEEELRSGTWATVRYARKVGKRVVFV